MFELMLSCLEVLDAGLERRLSGGVLFFQAFLESVALAFKLVNTVLLYLSLTRDFQVRGHARRLTLLPESVL